MHRHAMGDDSEPSGLKGCCDLQRIQPNHHFSGDYRMKSAEKSVVVEQLQTHPFHEDFRHDYSLVTALVPLNSMRFAGIFRQTVS